MLAVLFGIKCKKIMLAKPNNAKKSASSIGKSLLEMVGISSYQLWWPKGIYRLDVTVLYVLLWKATGLVGGSNCGVCFLENTPVHSFLMFCCIVSIILAGDTLNKSTQTLFILAKLKKLKTAMEENNIRAQRNSTLRTTWCLWSLRLRFTAWNRGEMPASPLAQNLWATHQACAQPFYTQNPSSLFFCLWYCCFGRFAPLAVAWQVMLLIPSIAGWTVPKLSRTLKLLISRLMPKWLGVVDTSVCLVNPALIT